MSKSSKSIDFRSSASLANLAARGELLRKFREFFHRRGFIEVETPLLAHEIIPELHIEPIAGDIRSPKPWFLQSSPELYMKQLLAAGATAIFQVTRSFRADERGSLHNPEFTIVEWYRVGDDLWAGIELLDELTQALFDTPPAMRTTYEEAFRRHAHLSPVAATLDELAKSVPAPAGMDATNRDEWLNLLLATKVEPQLGRDRPEILYHYPASQASLARTTRNDAGHEVAERFELYYRGIELANGFHELADADEQRRRFDAVNAARVADGRSELPVPESLLAALDHGLPDCTGCALGFDRLVMLAVGAETIDEVIAFPTGKV